MWLINCRTFVLEEVVDFKEARYAILSHTWQRGEEVQYSEFVNRRAPAKRGWEKIKKVCQLALDNGCDFAWVDTCCIHKTSSAELTEAINSMFPWYAGAEICYAYLADYDAFDPESEMSESRYFTRGWTLQELIAPVRVHFYDKSWNFIGTRDALGQQLSTITGIGQEILLDSKHDHVEEILAQVPIAQRMSWAAKRETTRIEDIAYCLLGIFGINLPLLYGEGERAFLRLQEEVAKTSNDLSLLAWLSPKDDPPTDIDRYCGVFAQHPRQFQASNNTSLINNLKFTPDFTTTNKGLKIHTGLYFNFEVELHVMDINCHDTERSERRLGIFLKHQGASVFARTRPDLFAPIRDLDSVTENRSIFLSKNLTPSVANSLNRVHAGAFVIYHKDTVYQHFVTAKPENLWDSANCMFITAGLKNFVGCCEYETSPNIQLADGSFRGNLDRFLVVFGYGHGFAPWIRLLPSNEHLVDEMKHADWRFVAQTTNLTSNRYLEIGTVHFSATNKEWREYVDVRLDNGVKRGESVYEVRVRVYRKPYSTGNRDNNS